ncbi:FecR family protein [Zobellia galactanivorans]|uniref:Anti-sigma factor n=1 Tax=Zobellia galactanivorans (strain DSM 12802 / CCUG 47099 / CIP 106680 / NCIMB 13871 / Dsij) TaxID=63186 RepID=G0L651_ZOBGA|nr:FecR domain-containing protein [Zobellia galactanivorans]CAZ96716.1 anti-sigma factor [Zobellia galactanivorans]
MQENHLAKWLNNDLTEAELAAFKKSAEYASYERIVAASNQLRSPDFNADEALMALKNQRTLKDSKVVQLHPFKKFLRVAAAAAIIMFGSYFYLNTLDKNIVTQYAENKEILLPDNSEVLLNADSELSFSERKWKKERNVSLKGEAFFKVAKGKRFTVATDAGTVAVLGTQFNVENRDGFFEVTCYEGLVSVTFKGKESKLPAGSSFMVIDGKIIETTAPKDEQPSWLNHESSFKSVPLKYVLNEFARQHNIKVEIENIDTDQLFTGTFSNTDTKLALKSISAPSQIKFKFEGSKVLFYGN